MEIIISEIVIPAEAGIHLFNLAWIPASAGMTIKYVNNSG